MSNAETRQIAAEEPARVDDLAMIIRQLVHRLKKHEPDSPLAAQALNYLRRKSLQGSIFQR